MTVEQFLAGKLSETQAELSGVILNRLRWDSVCDDRRMLVFLQGRAAAADFEGVRAELDRIARGYVYVPNIASPRRKAGDCLEDWATELKDLD